MTLLTQICLLTDFLKTTDKKVCFKKKQVAGSDYKKSELLINFRLEKNIRSLI